MLKSISHNQIPYSVVCMNVCTVFTYLCVCIRVCLQKRIELVLYLGGVFEITVNGLQRRKQHFGPISTSSLIIEREN